MNEHKLVFIRTYKIPKQSKAKARFFTAFNNAFRLVTISCWEKRSDALEDKAKAASTSAQVFRMRIWANWEVW